MQKERIKLLFAHSKPPKGLGENEAGDSSGCTRAGTFTACSSMRRLDAGPAMAVGHAVNALVRADGSSDGHVLRARSHLARTRSADMRRQCLLTGELQT